MSYVTDAAREYAKTQIKDDDKNYHDIYVQMQLDYDKALAQIDKIIADFRKKYPDSMINELYEHGIFSPGDLDCSFKSDMGYQHNGHLTKEEAIAEADDREVKWYEDFYDRSSKTNN